MRWISTCEADTAIKCKALNRHLSLMQFRPIDRTTTQPILLNPHNTYSSSTKLLANRPKNGTSTRSSVSAFRNAQSVRYPIKAKSPKNNNQLTIDVHEKMTCKTNIALNSIALCQA